MQNNSKNFIPQADLATASQNASAAITQTGCTAVPAKNSAAIPTDFRLSSYWFDLPEELIAQYPSAERGGSRLYLLRNNRNKSAGQEQDNVPDKLDNHATPSGPGALDSIISFRQLAGALPPNCLFVANNSRVLPARLPGRLPSGGKFEFLLLTPLPLLEIKETPPHEPSGNAAFFRTEKASVSWQQAEVEALLRPAKKFRPGGTYTLGLDDTAAPDERLQFTLLEKGGFGQCRALLHWRGNLLERIGRLGSLPLPPYIRRQAEAVDNDRYQTTFSQTDKCGSVAAPTAGLHFTPEIRHELIAAGHDWTELTLFVGYGTFSPVRERDIRDHHMHAEYVEIPEATVSKILAAKAAGRPVIAVGTTSARSLEGLAELLAGPAGEQERGHLGKQPDIQPDNLQEQNTHPLLTPWRGWLNCFIHPGKELRVIDGLLTNFHLPESTLLMLVSALCGRERLLAAYKQAVKEKMHFFSYGDAMLIL